MTCSKVIICFVTCVSFQTLTFNAQLKLHKPGDPIRPVINNKNAPSYKIAKHINDKLNGYLCRNNHYNVKKFHKLGRRPNKSHNKRKSQNDDIRDQRLVGTPPIQETALFRSSSSAHPRL